MSHRVILHNPSVHPFSDDFPTPSSTVISDITRTCASFQRLRERPGDDFVRVSSSVLGFFYRVKESKGVLFCSRLGVLCRLNRLGVYFTQEKQEAILRGDTSNSVIHRYFVDGLHAMATALSGSEATPAMVRLQARYTQAAWESFIQLTQTNQERAKAQATVLLAQSFIILGFNAAAQLYLLKACKIIEKEKLRFLPEYGLPVELSEGFREEASVLSGAIYLENDCYLMLGGSPPTKTARIEREFRFDLQVRATCCFSTWGRNRTWWSLLASVLMSLRDMPFDYADSECSVGSRGRPRSERRWP